jgi:hypothetical protein
MLFRGAFCFLRATAGECEIVTPMVGEPAVPSTATSKAEGAWTVERGAEKLVRDMCRRGTNKENWRETNMGLLSRTAGQVVGARAC